jgi:hypothetical protein
VVIFRVWGDVKWDTRAFLLVLVFLFIVLFHLLASQPRHPTPRGGDGGSKSRCVSGSRCFLCCCYIFRTGFAWLVFILYFIVSRVEAAWGNGRQWERVDDGDEVACDGIDNVGKRWYILRIHHKNVSCLSLFITIGLGFWASGLDRV